MPVSSALIGGSLSHDSPLLGGLVVAAVRERLAGTAVETVLLYVAEQAILPSPWVDAGPEREQRWSQSRASTARVWLWLPVLWAARTGDLHRAWRDELPVAEVGDVAAVEVAAAAMSLAELPIQPWEPFSGAGERPALDSWFRVVATLMFDTIFSVRDAVAQRRVDPDNSWYSFVVPAAAQQAVNVLHASYSSAVLQPSMADDCHDPVGEPGRSVEFAATIAGFSDADRGLIEPPAPWYWRPGLNQHTAFEASATAPHDRESGGESTDVASPATDCGN